MKGITIALIIAISGMALTASPARAQRVANNLGSSTIVYKKSMPTDEYFRAEVRLGAPPSWARTEAQKMVWALDEGRARALLALAQALGDVYLTSDRKIEDARLVNRKVEAGIRQVVRYAEEVSWDRIPLAGEEGQGIMVTMRVPRYGPNSLASVFYPDLRREAAEDVATLGHVEAPEAPPEPEAPQVVYSGLVVDARGLNLEPALAPRVLSDSGQIVYHILDTKYAETIGVVGYGKSLDSPRTLRDRVGPNPLQVQAIRRKGTSDVVVSDGDAERILYTNAHQEHKFLAECRVVFLID